MWCHVVRAIHLVEMFVCVDISLWESEVSHCLKEYYMDHASKASLEVGVSRVDAFFDIFASSYVVMCVDKLSCIFLCRMDPFMCRLIFLVLPATGSLCMFGWRSIV